MLPSTTAWNEIFKRQGRAFTEPHEDLPRIAQLLKERKANIILDLGSGTGRHVVYLARSGFNVFGLDNSAEGIRVTRQWLTEEGLDADLQLQSMADKLPYADAFFDAVISVQTIHHADSATIKAIAAEVNRVLKQGGLLFVTVPKLRNQAERFEQIEQNTFIPLDGPEKGVPHHYFTLGELRELLTSYHAVDFHLDTWHHYCLLASKR